MDRVVIFGLLTLVAQRAFVAPQSTSSTSTSTIPQFTVPASADVGLPVIPNIDDSKAIDAQSVCPGYTASNVQQNDNGFTATLNLAGNPCNVYGTDVSVLNLAVQYQTTERVNINIYPANLVRLEAHGVDGLGSYKVLGLDQFFVLHSFR
jgi:alpha-glucosidase